MRLKKEAEKRILIIDGAMGTMIQKYALSEADFRNLNTLSDSPHLLKGNNDLLNLTRPDVVADIHRKYLEAGADIIETNTFNANFISQTDYGTEKLCREMNRAAASIARHWADKYSTFDKPRFVAGSVGPTNKSCSLSPDVNNSALRSVTFDEMKSAYLEQMSVLIEEGVDALLCETVFDTLNLKAALSAAGEAMEKNGKEVALMVSITLSSSGGRTLSGQTIEAFLASVSHARIFSVGLNCSFGAEQLKPFLKVLAAQAPYYISAYPNAGLPNSMGGYDQTPEQMAAQIKEYIDEDLVNIIGGCCGTTDEYIARFPALVQGILPHRPVPKSNSLQLSGLERLEIRPEMNFINIGERCNVAGSRKFLRLINEKKYDEALAIARKQVNDGAQVLDINMDDALLDTKTEMIHFLNLIGSEPEITRVPLMIDSSKWEVIAAGLKCLQGKSIVNSLSLKEGEECFLSHASEVHRMGAAVVVMAFDEEGQAVTYERKISVCERAYRLLTEKIGFPPQDIIFDPNILAVATGLDEHADYATDYIKACEWIKRNLPLAHVSGGVSNLSFSFRGNDWVREAMHAVFLYHAIRCGMDMGIVNPAASVTYEEIPDEIRGKIEDVLFNTRPDATERLVEAAGMMKKQNAGTMHSPEEREEWRTLPVEERLQTALLKGIGEYLKEDLEEAEHLYPSALSIIEGPLMNGINRVGELFGAGKLFLPQVVKTARTMKQAVALLQPSIEEQKSASQPVSAGKVLLATVKGDVHDIGKNIVSVIMTCNGYRIIDLGVMVPAEKIVQTAIEEKADIIGLSGLITPSLDEMVHIARLLQQNGLSIPLMIGGATTNELHTALRIAPVYDAPVVHVKDASQNPLIAAKLLSPAQHDAFIAQLQASQALLREEAKLSSSAADLLSLEKARKNKLNLF